LRIVFFSDWRAQPLALISTILRSLSAAEPVDVVLYGGDDVGRFGRPMMDDAWDALGLLRLEPVGDAGECESTDLVPLQVPPDGWTRRVASGPTVQRELSARYVPPPFRNGFSELADLTKQGLAGVIGNDCQPTDRWVLDAEGCRNLHLTPWAVQGWGILGIEGAPFLPVGPRVGIVLHEDADIARQLAWARSELSVIPAQRLIVVSHAPPAGVLDEGIRYGLGHLGSPALAAFVKRRQPALVLCGHVHSQGGRVERVGRTLVVNAASEDDWGQEAHVALIELDPDQTPIVTWIDWRQYSLTGLPGIGRSKAAALEAAGLDSQAAVYAASDDALLEAGISGNGIARIRLGQLADELDQPVRDAPWLVAQPRSWPMISRPHWVAGSPG